MGTTYTRYRQTRVADNLDDQATSGQISNALLASTTEEDLQHYYLSRLRQVIFGNASPHHWYEDFLGEGVLSLADLTAFVSVGTSQCIRFPITTAPAQTSTTLIPAGSLVINAMVDIQTIFSPGTIIQVGQAGNPSLLMGTSDTFPTAQNLYEAPQDTLWGPTALPVLVTVLGAPVSGLGVCIITYTRPTS